MARKRNLSKLKGKWHYQACTECLSSATCACTTPEIDKVCISCRSGRRAIWDQARLPLQCCLDNQPLKPMHKHGLEEYRLAGTRDWFRCPTCARVFPVQPGMVKAA